MSRRFGLPTTGWTWFRLFLLAFTAVVLMTVDTRTEGGVLGGFRSATMDILGPLRRLGDAAADPFRNAWRGITTYDDLQAENDALRAQLADAEGSVLRVGELERERRDALALLGARDVVPNIGRVAARVIDAPVSNYERTVELDRGSRDGVAVGMPVESGAGLVGRVAQVSRTRSRVELLTDPNFDVGVRMARTADDGLASGVGANEPLEVRFIDLETLVILGETVVTSGFSGSTFPPGLLVGTVLNVTPNASQGTQHVLVHPAADLNHLRLVDVILYRPDEGDPPVLDRPAGDAP